MNELVKLIESIEDVWYHGSSHDIKSFSLEFVGTGNDQYGPGVYFTKNKELASRYGDILYVCSIDTSTLLSVKTKINKNIIRDLIVNTPDEIAYTNWDENKNRADAIGISQIMSTCDNMYDALMEVWSTWYHDNTKDFVESISKWYNGGIAMDGNEPYLMVYNTAAITVQDILRL